MRACKEIPFPSLNNFFFIKFCKQLLQIACKKTRSLTNHSSDNDIILILFTIFHETNIEL